MEVARRILCIVYAVWLYNLRVQWSVEGNCRWNHDPNPKLLP
jgi:hypothetical protein